MVSLPSLRAMERYYDSHLKELVRKHPGEWVVVYENHYTIYSSERKMRKEHPASSRLVFGTQPLIRRIPRRYHKLWSVMNPTEQSRVVSRETTALLRKLDRFEKRSRESSLQLD